MQWGKCGQAPAGRGAERARECGARPGGRRRLPRAPSGPPASPPSPFGGGAVFRLLASRTGVSAVTYPTPARARLTSEPQEVVHRAEQLHRHVVVHQRVLQHARLEAQVPHVLPHAPLAPLLVVPETQSAWGRVTAGGRPRPRGPRAKRTALSLHTDRQRRCCEGNRRLRGGKAAASTARRALERSCLHTAAPRTAPAPACRALRRELRADSVGPGFSLPTSQSHHWHRSLCLGFLKTSLSPRSQLQTYHCLMGRPRCALQAKPPASANQSSSSPCQSSRGAPSGQGLGRARV